MTWKISSNDLGFNPVGAHTQNSSLSSVVTLTMVGGATKWLAQCQTQNVRFTLDGTTATTTKGFRLTAGNDPVIVPVGPATVIKVIEEAATAVLDYQFGT